MSSSATSRPDRSGGRDLGALQGVIDARPATRHDYLETRGLRVTFDGFVAVKDVDLTVEPGDLRFLIGPNGAGKTTIIDALTGLVPATGVATLGRTSLLGRRSHDIVRAGVGRTFQTASVIEQLSVLANLDLAEGVHRPRRALLRARPAVSEQVESALEIVGLAHLRDRPAGTLAHGQKQWLEIGMLLVQEPRLLLLDEPVAGMSHAEREQTGELLRRLRPGRTMIVVEHDMEFLRAVADSVTVLAAGEVISEGDVASIQADPRVQEVYLGRSRRGGGSDAAV